jgi:amidase
VETRTLADVIAFNKRTPAELKLFGQEIFEQAEATKGLDDPAYLAAREKARRLAGAEGIDALMREHRLDAIVAPSGSPAWTSDTVLGDHFVGGSSTLAAVAGYPNVSVPMGQVRGLPVGLSIFGAAWSEAKLIGIAYAFEQRTKARRAPLYLPAVPD